MIWLPFGFTPITIAITESDGQSDTVDEVSALVLACSTMDGQHLEKVIRRERASFIVTRIERNGVSNQDVEMLDGSLKPWMSKWQQFSSKQPCTVFQV